jgi:hypothetical protein
MESEIDAATDTDAKHALGKRVQAVADKHPDDVELLSVANGLLHRLGLLEVDRKIATQSPESESATLTYNAPRAGTSHASAHGLTLTATSNASTPPETVLEPAEPVPPMPPLPPPAPLAISAAKPAADALKAKPPASKLKQPAGGSQRLTTLILASAVAMVLAGVVFLFVHKRNAPSHATTGNGCARSLGSGNAASAGFAGSETLL